MLRQLLLKMKLQMSPNSATWGFAGDLGEQKHGRQTQTRVRRSVTGRKKGGRKKGKSLKGAEKWLLERI